VRQSFHLGFDYYPEHWPEAMWPDDLRMMCEVGATVVRIAEFAWSRMEPGEGQFDFHWLDRFFQLAAQHEVGIILGTPTAAPPPWVWQNYPDVVMVEANGQRAHTTGRRYNCPTSPNYLRLCDAIVEQMASRYGGHASLIGWQTDNEVNGQVCFCEHCQAACRSWLREKYGTVEALNEAHGLVFWAHEVTDWDQVIVPRPGLDRAHPSLRLDVHRFFSHAWAEFLGRQTAIIRAHSPGRWVTHNLPGVNIRADLFELAAAHDFLSLDTYPRATLDDWGRVASSNDITRSVQPRSHWVMEIQSGTPCTKFYKAPVPRPGQLRLWAHQCAAHGAEGVVFFRWRKSPAGQEMFGNGLLDQDSRARRTYQEVQRLGHEFAVLSERLPAYDHPADVAVVMDFADRINAEIHQFAIDVPFMPHMLAWWRAARSLGLNVQFVRSTDDLSPYALVLAPNAYTTSPAIVENFTRCVHNGGVLVGMLRMGWFSPDGKPAQLTMPGGMTDLFGAEVEEYERVMETNPNRVLFRNDVLPAAECRGWNYVLAGMGAKALGTYESDEYAGRPAVTLNEAGSGHAIYVGTLFDAATVRGLVRFAARLAGLTLLPEDWPEDVERVILRSHEGEPVWVVLNHTSEPQTVKLPTPADDLLGDDVVDTVELAPLGVQWLKPLG